MERKRAGLLAVLLLALLCGAGCSSVSWPQQFNFNSQEEAQTLVKVDIHFDGQDHLVAWVAEMGVGSEDDVYSGGTSRCYYYDEDGNVEGIFNYQKVTYIEKLE